MLKGPCWRRRIHSEVPHAYSRLPFLKWTPRTSVPSVKAPLPAVPPTDMFWGDRYSWLRDPFGHMWALSEIREVLTPEEVQERMQGFTAQRERYL